MGTRSTVKFYSGSDVKKETPLLSVYQQYDGYYEGVGFELADFLKDKKVINGYNTQLGQTMENGFANGMGCLAAQYVAKHKDKIGGFYITHAGDEQGYDYKVFLKDGLVNIEIDDFIGMPEQFAEWVKSQESA